MDTRPATAADYPHFVRLFAELATGDHTPSAQVWADELAPQTTVGEFDGAVVGYIYAQLLDGLGFVRHIAIDQTHRGQGFGRVLMQCAAQRMREAGATQWCLNVRPDNPAALALYTRLGMTQRFASVAMRMDWTITGELPPPPPSVVVAVLEPDDDVAAEAALSLPAGLLSQNRVRRGARLLLARDDDAIVGAAVFRPEFPGAYPFRARDGGIACALLSAMRPHADPSKTFMQVVLEDAPTLERVFGDAGAARHLEFVQLRGPLPNV